MKRCVICKEQLALSEFNRKRSARDGLQDVCRSCNRAQARRYYANNREKHLRVVMERTRRSREVSQSLIAAYLLNHPCVDCGEADLRVLDFDHRPGERKSAEVMLMVRRGFGFARIAAEIAKCEVRCRNCHAKVTYERAGNSWRQRYAAAQLSARRHGGADGHRAPRNDS